MQQCINPFNPQDTSRERECRRPRNNIIRLKNCFVKNKALSGKLSILTLYLKGGFYAPLKENIQKLFQSDFLGSKVNDFLINVMIEGSLAKIFSVGPPGPRKRLKIHILRFFWYHKFLAKIAVFSKSRIFRGLLKNQRIIM